MHKDNTRHNMAREVSNEELRRRSRPESLSEKAVSRVIRWAVHVLRMDDQPSKTYRKMGTDRKENKRTTKTKMERCNDRRSKIPR